MPCEVTVKITTVNGTMSAKAPPPIKKRFSSTATSAAGAAASASLTAAVVSCVVKQDELNKASQLVDFVQRRCRTDDMNNE